MTHDTVLAKAVAQFLGACRGVSVRVAHRGLKSGATRVIFTLEAPAKKRAGRGRRAGARDAQAVDAGEEAMFPMVEAEPVGTELAETAPTRAMGARPGDAVDALIERAAAARGKGVGA